VKLSIIDGKFGAIHIKQSLRRTFKLHFHGTIRTRVHPRDYDGISYTDFLIFIQEFVEISQARDIASSAIIDIIARNLIRDGPHNRTSQEEHSGRGAAQSPRRRLGEFRFNVADARVALMSAMRDDLRRLAKKIRSKFIPG